MDELGFSQKQKFDHSIYLQRSGNFCTKSVDANFFMTYVVDMYETGYWAPPLLIIPGQKFNWDLIYVCDIP